jgi:glutathione peroxidase
MSVYDFKVKTIDGKETTLAPYHGKVLLIVNVASECGFTSQYSGLEDLRRKYHERGFEVLGFPCNQFGAQEPGTEAQIKQFCESRFQVSFPLFAKIEVNGPGTHPLWEYLKTKEKGVLGTTAIKWNFTKFLVGPDGTVEQRFAPQAEPASLENQIQALLPQ